MITSNQIFNLLEKYKTLCKERGLSSPIYINPDKSDFLDLIKTAASENRKLETIRFVADARNEKVCIADAHNLIHDDMRKALRLINEFNYRKAPFQLDGLAKVQGGIAIATAWDKYDVEIAHNPRNSSVHDWIQSTFQESNWKFVDQYIKGTSSMMLSYSEKYWNLREKMHKSI